MQTNKVVQGVTQLPPDAQQAAGGSLVSTFPATTGPPRAEKECQTMELKMPTQPLEQHSLKLQGSPSEVQSLLDTSLCSFFSLQLICKLNCVHWD
jgi:hypothetical protein